MKKETNLEKKKVMSLVMIGAAIIIIVLALIFAFYKSRGNNGEVLTSRTLVLKFEDNNSSLMGNLGVDTTISKKFTIENTGNLEDSVELFWNNLVNTYTEGSLSFTLSKSEKSDGPFTKIVGKTNIPVSKTSSKQSLANNLTVPANKKFYYNLEITYNNLVDVNQDADASAKFSTSFSIK